LGGYYGQDGFGARFEWGLEGLRALAPGVASVVIVDVLSFSTAVDVALGRGARVYPYRWRDASAERFARAHEAQLAVGRRDMTEARPLSLSPGSLRRLEPGTAVVLPSPNGSTLTLAASELGARVLVGCLRNAGAVARAAREAGGPVCVLAAGEQWPDDDSLRPAFEDQVGAGAILDALDAARPSPEALSAIAAFRAVREGLEGALLDCASGRQLTEVGFPDDVREAARLDASRCVPLLEEGVLVDGATALA
jgi:2-phosphosulfolactate phosphatase